MRHQWTLISRIAVGCLLLAPIAAYLWKFGPLISNDHARWGEFGSAMSGIYTPALTMATIAILAMQVRLQSAAHTHATDMAYIQQARADVEFYILRLSTEVSVANPGHAAPRIGLHQYFQPGRLEDLDTQMLRDMAVRFDRENPRIFAIFCALQALLAGLSASEESTYTVNRTSAVQKMIALLSFETCVCLENFHRARSEGRLRGPYIFSPLLSPK